MNRLSALLRCFPLYLLLLLPTARADQTFSHSGTPPLLIELYTSEGCSSCPPADRFLSRFVDAPDLWQRLIPLAFHVDYWDYIGWSDRFAHPDYKLRQYNYRKSGRISSVYTPGWVINGNEWRGFFRNQPLPLALEHNGGTLKAVLTLENNLQVSYASSVIRTPITAHVALLGFDFVSQVTAGENRGKQLHHQFVVLDKQQQSGPASTWRFKLPVEKNRRQALAVWITQGDLELLQATGGWINSNQ